MLKQEKEFVIDLLLVDPDTHQNMEIASPLIANKDGTYSLACLNLKTGVMWKHTIHTEEITVGELRKMRGAGDDGVTAGRQRRRGAGYRRHSI